MSNLCKFLRSLNHPWGHIELSVCPKPGLWMTHKTRSLFIVTGSLLSSNPLDQEIIMVLLYSTSWDGDHLHPCTSMKQPYVLIFSYGRYSSYSGFTRFTDVLVASDGILLRIPKTWQRHSRAL